VRKGLGENRGRKGSQREAEEGKSEEEAARGPRRSPLDRVEWEQRSNPIAECPAGERA